MHHGSRDRRGLRDGRHDVVLIGRNPESLEVALAKIATSVDEFVARGLLREGSTTDALARITIETSLESAEGAGLVIEALPRTSR